MGGFKLVAIVPLEGCHERFSKNLLVGNVYKFYQDYNILLDEENMNVISFSPKNADFRSNIFELENNIQLNISAVVGKNGSGKSSLLELLYYVIYRISVQKRLRRRTTEIVQERLNEINTFTDIHGANSNDAIRYGVVTELLRISNYRNLNSFYIDLARILKSELPDHFRNQKQNDIDTLFTAALTARQEKLTDELNEEQIFQDLLNQNLNVSLFFEKEDALFELKLNGSDVSLKNWTDADSDYREFYNFEFKELFYSISINYSHHSLNKRIQGRWLDELFHKNDGYKTPIVINPMRHDGNFDINREEAFARSRLLSNIVSGHLSGLCDRDVLLNESQDILAVQFKLKKEIKRGLNNDWRWYDRGVNMLRATAQIFLFDELNTDYESIKKLPYAKALVEYFDQKFDKIRYTYNGYKEIRKPQGEEGADGISDYVLAFKQLFDSDESHVTFKMRQIVNFFKSCSSKESGNLWSKEGEHIFTIDELINFSRITTEDSYQTIIEKLPPSIFDIEFFFTSKTNGREQELEELRSNFETRREAQRFGKLSSGEKQLIHSVQTVIYHINNLNSIEDRGPMHPAYSRINVIFDEIELYFHPDLQRRFVQYLISSLNRLRLKAETCVNVIFATHSPFILSDIPSSNILRLVEGKPMDQPKQTFAANIYDLLNDDFFLDKGVIGEFAKRKINHILEKNVITKKDMELLELIGDPFLKSVVLEKARSADYEKDNELINAQIELLRKQLKNKGNEAD